MVCLDYFPALQAVRANVDTTTETAILVQCQKEAQQEKTMCAVACQFPDLQHAHVEGFGVLALDVRAAHAGGDLAVLLHREQRLDAQVRADSVGAVSQQRAQMMHLAQRKDSQTLQFLGTLAVWAVSAGDADGGGPDALPVQLIMLAVRTSRASAVSTSSPVRVRFSCATR